MAVHIWPKSVGGYRRNISVILCKKIIVVLDFIESSTPWRYTCLLSHRESIAGWMSCRYLLHMLWRVGQLASVEVANRHWYGKSQIENVLHYSLWSLEGIRDVQKPCRQPFSHSLTQKSRCSGGRNKHTLRKLVQFFSSAKTDCDTINVKLSICMLWTHIGKADV
jgi:hypothetical protein